MIHKQPIFRIVLLCAVIITTFNFCSVQKRSYRPGYHITWKHNKQATHSVAKTTNYKNPEVSKHGQMASTTSPEQEEIPLESNSGDVLRVPLKQKRLIKLDDECGDLIIMRDGNQVLAKVLEISDEKIKYKRCDNLEGPVIVTSVSKVQTIKFSNGVTQSFEGSPSALYQNNSKTSNYQGPKKTHPLAILAFVCALVGIWPLSFLGSIVALILVRNTERKIAANPEKYKGEGLLKAAKIISYGMLFLLILGLILYLLVLGFFL